MIDFFLRILIFKFFSLLSVLFSFFRKYLWFLLVASEERKFSKDLFKNSLQEPVQDITAFFVTSLQETKACSRPLRDTRITFSNHILHRDTDLITSSNFFPFNNAFDATRSKYHIFSLRVFFFSSSSFSLSLFPSFRLSLLFVKFN